MGGAVNFPEAMKEVISVGWGRLYVESCLSTRNDYALESMLYL